MNVYCLACDRGGDCSMIEVAEPEDLQKIVDHYNLRHPDVRLDRVDADVVTMSPKRLRSVQP